MTKIVGIGEATADSDLSTNSALVTIGEIPMAQLLCSSLIHGKGDGRMATYVEYYTKQPKFPNKLAIVASASSSLKWLRRSRTTSGGGTTCEDVE